jgi:transposase-like protein
MREKKIMRQFSESFKKEKVKQIEEKKITVLQLSRIYEVSPTAIYKWIRKYSKYAGKNERIVVEKESEGEKTMQLLKKIAELEQLLGQKQVEVEYLKKVIEFGSELTETNIKKKYESRS